MRVLNADAAKRLHEENGSAVLPVPADTFITRGARRYIEEQGLTVNVKPEKPGRKVSAEKGALHNRSNTDKRINTDKQTNPGALTNPEKQQEDISGGNISGGADDPSKTKAKAGITVSESKLLADGRAQSKPEHLTSLFGNTLVVKNHPRIVLRGKLDSFQGRLLEAQLLAEESGDGRLKEELQEILDDCRAILCAEVMDTPLEVRKLLGMTEAELRYVSQHPSEYFGVGHIAPAVEMGEICVVLNSLRAQSREVELAAVGAFCRPAPGRQGQRADQADWAGTEADAGAEYITERTDLLRALNRLSSGLYVIYCEQLQKRMNLNCAASDTFCEERQTK